MLGVGIGNFANEMTSFYVQQDDPWQFADEAIAEGIGSPSRLKLSFGLFFFDYDLDGRLDLLQANGHLEDEINEIQPSQHYRQPAQLFWNCGARAAVLLRGGAGGRLGRPGAADRRARRGLRRHRRRRRPRRRCSPRPVDRPLLLRNDQELGHHWLRVRLVGRGANREAIGACVLLTAGGQTQRRR